MTKAQLQERIGELESEAEDLVDALKESDDNAKAFEKRAVEADQFQECLETLQASHLELSRAEEIRNPDYIFSNAHAAELEFTQCAIGNDIEADT